MGFNVIWDAIFNARPVGSDILKNVAAHIRETREGLRERLGLEHVFSLSGNDTQGAHREGSARVWVRTSAPTSPVPTGSDDGSDLTTGRLWVNPDTGELSVYKDTAWLTLTTEAATAKRVPLRNAAGEVLTAKPGTDSPAGAAANKAYVDEVLAAKEAEIETAINTAVTAARTAMAETIMPVGFAYTQFPGCYEPAYLYGDLLPNATWVRLSELLPAAAGVFFRHQGGNANLFDASFQESAIGAHKHAIDSSGISFSVDKWNTSRLNRSVQAGSTDPNDLAAHTIDGFPVETAETGTIETRPVNMTILVWIRTA